MESVIVYGIYICIGLGGMINNVLPIIIIIISSSSRSFIIVIIIISSSSSSGSIHFIIALYTYKMI